MEKNPVDRITQNPRDFAPSKNLFSYYKIVHRNYQIEKKKNKIKINAKQMFFIRYNFFDAIKQLFKMTI